MAERAVVVMAGKWARYTPTLMVEAMPLADCVRATSTANSGDTS